jgi:hypothetical protein
MVDCLRIDGYVAYDKVDICGVRSLTRGLLLLKATVLLHISALSLCLEQQART